MAPLREVFLIKTMKRKKNSFKTAASWFVSTKGADSYGRFSYGELERGILISKFGSKDMLLWKRDFPFVFTEDENLWINIRQMWFNGPKPTKSQHEQPPKTGRSLERTTSIFQSIV